MRAGDMVTLKGRHVEKIEETESLGEAIDRMARKNIGAVLVINRAGRPSGIVSERDVMRVMAGAPTGIRQRPVHQVMTAELVTCHPDETVDELLDLMTERRFRHVPVMDGDELLGLLSIGDVVKHRMREVKAEAEALRMYIAGT
ncbi:MAG: CBS domain-containing protein [Pseudomonadota bacterium]